MLPPESIIVSTMSNSPVEARMLASCSIVMGVFIGAPSRSTPSEWNVPVVMSMNRSPSPSAGSLPSADWVSTSSMISPPFLSTSKKVGLM